MNLRRLSRLCQLLAPIAVLLLAKPAMADDPQAAVKDLSQIVSFVRWSGLMVSAFVLVGALVLVRFIRTAVDRLSVRFTHRRLTLQKLESFTRFFIYIAVGVVTIALSFRINETLVTLLGGTLAVAIGFSLRDLVAAMIAGVTIMLDRPFQVGDRVNYAGEYGDIISIGLRSVRMQTLDDNTVTIPNNKILTDVTSCGNYGALDMQVAVEFFVGVDQNLKLAARLIEEAITSCRFAFLDKPVVVGMKQQMAQDIVAVKLTGKGYVLDTKYEAAFVSDVTRRVLEAFAEHDVLPPAKLVRSASAA
jgi:small-conductance mechanosensitive channel